MYIVFHNVKDTYVVFAIVNIGGEIFPLYLTAILL